MGRVLTSGSLTPDSGIEVGAVAILPVAGQSMVMLSPTSIDTFASVMVTYFGIVRTARPRSVSMKTARKAMAEKVLVLKLMMDLKMLVLKKEVQVWMKRVEMSVKWESIVASFSVVWIEVRSRGWWYADTSVGGGVGVQSLKL